MLFTIAKRRFLANILTSRFIVAAVLIEVLFISSTAVLIRGYARRQQQFHTEVQKHDKEMSNADVYAQLSVRLDRPPEPLSIFSAGADRRIAGSVSVAHNAAPVMISGAEEDNPLLSVFSSLDMITIIQIILSLTVLLFSYNVVSEEKEKGTLRLVFSNNLPRHTFLAGNILGGLLSLFLPLLLGFLSAFLLAYLHPAVQLTGTDMLRLVLVILAAMLFLSVFYSLGVLFSILMKRSSTSLVFLLFIWVFLVILLPPGIISIVRQIKPVESQSAIDQQAEALRKEWYKRMWEYKDNHPRPEFIGEFIRDRYVETGYLPYAYHLGYAPREVAEWLINGSIYGHNLKIEYEDRIYELYHQYNVLLYKQAVLADQLLRFSPSAVFYKFACQITGTDASVQLRFMEQAEQYRQRLIQYIRNKGGLSSYRLITGNPPEAFLPVSDLIRVRDTEGYERVKSVIEKVYNPKDVKPLDLSDIPRFKFLRLSLTDSLNETLPDLIVLILLNLLLLTGCWITFIRSDVR